MQLIFTQIFRLSLLRDRSRCSKGPHAASRWARLGWYDCPQSCVRSNVLQSLTLIANRRSHCEWKKFVQNFIAVNIIISLMRQCETYLVFWLLSCSECECLFQCCLLEMVLSNVRFCVLPKELCMANAFACVDLKQGDRIKMSKALLWGCNRKFTYSKDGLMLEEKIGHASYMPSYMRFPSLRTVCPSPLLRVLS